jgi:biopolymer transport protein ExbB
VANDAVQVKSIWDFVVKGGPVMIPIGICSLVAVTVVIERLISLRHNKIIPPDFQPTLTGLLSDRSAERRQKALGYCQNHGTPIAAIFAAGIKKLGEPVELVERYIQEAGQREIQKLRKHLRTLSVIAAISPLLGLLGTILGMITAFETVAASGEALGRTELLAKGIYEAMITTAGGLIVAIPVVIAYHWFSARVERLVAVIDALVVDFIEDHARPAPPVVGVVREAVRSTMPASDNGNEPAAAVALAVG